MSFSGSFADFEHQTRMMLSSSSSKAHVIAGDDSNSDSKESDEYTAMRQQLRDNVTTLVARLCSFVTDDVIGRTTDLLAQDFMQHRLPPPTELLELDADRPDISMTPNSMVSICT